MHNCLPTNCFIFHRHITQDASCHLCCVTKEIILHVLCGTTTNLNPELQVIAKGLQLALNEWYRAVVCESDSKTTLMLIDEGVHDTHPYAPIDLVFAHSLCEGNSCADWLAKFGATMDYGFKV
ncbi:hypothetical protein JHK85_007468 [Glycine max]|uniref:RNase H type-1 domain-containing protein n=2 Tax=Glycine subgen. Soja TaxID=1462606 RepID=A0A0R0KQ36_SOYBN|nr:hypothetical protein JHK87_007091 [Glycine soja]KAG5054958.1 hypothetical protein JHK85_007468 [Glycine max]KAG5072045.1 hypothetical protein JHK86_007256 [Glycine max]KAH1069609.1 hypothetical protein GYH30_006985 [Glycine max]RZC20275.1 hypothetical protein D0Y65_006923 [Glycine soja]